MASRVKAGVRAAIDRMGFVVAKKPPIAFPELVGLPRYVAREVELCGGRFLVGDAASFLSSYREIFQEEIYRFDNHAAAPVIVDCGANYGVSVRYFKMLFPDCRITAVEADPQIFAMLAANVEAAELECVKLLNRAVSDTAEPVTFYSEGADAGRIHELPGGSKADIIEGVTLDELIDGHVDFLKVDIEGAETAVLRSCSKLACVEQMFVEYHSFSGDPQSLDELLKILREHGFRYYIHTQLCSPRPLTLTQEHMGMDMQLNIFAKKIDSGVV